MTEEQLRAVAERHQLALAPTTAPLSGAASTVYVLNEEAMLRIPRAEPQHRATFEREATVIPLARQAGVRTPALLALGTLPEQPDTPYMLLERVRGENLGTLNLAPRDISEVYRDLGRDLARWHLRRVDAHDPLAPLPRDSHPDPRSEVARLAEQGFLDRDGARWLKAWLDRLAPHAARPLTWRVVHGDARPTNLMVESEPPSYRALLDWGDARWADPASEFALMPLRAVPFALKGYRDLRPDAGDEVNERRVLWYHLAWAVLALSRSPSTERTWSAPPAGRLLELMRFFVENPPSPWAELVPRNPVPRKPVP